MRRPIHPFTLVTCIDVQQRETTKNVAPMIDFADFQFSFSGVMSQAPARDELRRYMRTRERNEELLMFFESCEQLQAMLSSSEMDTATVRQAVIDIHDEYINRSSYRQINISADTVRKVTDLVNQFLNTNDFTLVVKIFKPALSSVVNSMENDVFVRFVRSDGWMKYLNKKYRNSCDLHGLGFHKSQNVFMKLTVEDEDRELITWRDVMMADIVRKDYVDWKLKHITPKFTGVKYAESMMLFKAKMDIVDPELQKRGILQVTKRIATFNVSAKDLFTTLHAGEKQIEIFGDIMQKNASVVRPKQTPTDTDDVPLNSIHFKYELDLKIPFVKRRRLNMCFSSIYLPTSGRYVVLMKPGPEVVESVNASSTVAARVYSWVVFEPIDANRCRQSVIIATNLGGKLVSDNALTKWTSMKALIKTSIDQLKKQDKALSWYIDENQRPEVRDDTRTFELLELNQDIGHQVDKLLVR